MNRESPGEPPAKLPRVAREHLSDVAASRAVHEEQRLYEFRRRHDFSHALQGAVAPPLWVVREGREAWLATESRPLRLPVDTVLAAIRQLGDDIVERVSSLDDERSCEAKADWAARGELDVSRKVGIATGLPGTMLDEIAADRVGFWTSGASGRAFAPNELMAAARMAGSVVPAAILRDIVEQIRAVPLRYGMDAAQRFAIAPRSHRPSPDGDIILSAFVHAEPSRYQGNPSTRAKSASVCHTS